MERQNVELASRIRELLASGDYGQITEILSDLHPADFVEVLEELELTDRGRILTLFDDEFIASIFEKMDHDQVAPILRLLGRDRTAPILESMATDDLADLLGELPKAEASRLLGMMESEEAEDVQELLEYDEETAGGIMTTEYIALEQDLTASAATDQLRQLAQEAETAYYIYVVDPSGRLTGVVSLRELITAPADARLRDIMEANVVSVPPDTDQEDVARLVARYDLLAIPVVDGANQLLGIVTVDDVIDVIEEEATEDIYRMAGTGADESEELMAGTWLKIRRRLPWLAVLLVSNFLSANVIQGFTLTLERIVALAYFIPVLIDMGGNVGTQSFAVVIRGLSTGELDTRRLFRIVLREAEVGVVMGVIFGSAMALIASFWQGSPMLGLVVGLAMALTLITASVIGTFVPLFFDRVGVDIAVASGPFITTVVDVTGLVIYFWLATMFMQYLGV
ncbi:MAG: magnesium transporter [Bacillota bacterium]